jgi:hypothetical protein
MLARRSLFRPHRALAAVPFPHFSPLQDWIVNIVPRSSAIPRGRTGAPLDHTQRSACDRAVIPLRLRVSTVLASFRRILFASYILGERPLFKRALEARTVSREASHALRVHCLSDNLICVCVTSLGGYLMTVLYPPDAGIMLCYSRRVCCCR